jgi:hypothetical protein
MKPHSLIVNLAIACLLSGSAFGQISEADSTVQVVGYWSKGDKQSYLLTKDRYTVTGTDTTDREISQTEIDVTVLDSTATSYTIEWLYKSIKSTSKDPLVQKFYKLAQNVKFVITTNEMGTFGEVANVKDLQLYATNTAQILKKELKATKNADAIVNRLYASFASKESIENDLSEEIYQFYFYHGGKYKLDVPATMKLELPNASGGKPIAAELVIKLTEINAEDDNYVIRSSQLVDKAQATEATFQILRQSNQLEEGFTRDQMPEVIIEDTMAARIHGTGWTTYSTKTKTITTGDTSDVEQWTIELQ